jgi:hypothetical protein
MSDARASRLGMAASAGAVTEPAYKARVKSGAAWRAVKDRIRVEISVGAEYHNGPKFAAVKDMINRNHLAWLERYGDGKRVPPADEPCIEAVDLCINCTLQRYNRIADGENVVAATVGTFDDGTAWRERHQPLIDQIAVPVLVHRWPDWTGPANFETELWRIRARGEGEDTRAELAALIARRRPGFENKLRRVKALAQADGAFRDLVKADIDTILERRIKHGKAPRDEAAFRASSLDYIHEELAAFALMPPAVVVYPGSNLGSVEYFLTHTVPGLELLSTVHRARIDFDRGNAVVPGREPERHTPRGNTPAAAATRELKIA